MSNKPWENEPDVFDFESHGMKCQIRRVKHAGHLCGYVGVPKSHPWFGKSYDADVPASRALLERPINIDKVGAINLLFRSESPTEAATPIVLLIDVHGGLTFSENGSEFEHMEGLWVFGFDCAHSGDLCPVTVEEFGIFRAGETYRDFAYVKSETESLARQLAAIHGV